MGLYVLLFIYKGTTYFYPSGTMVWENIMLALFFLVETSRLNWLSRGNKLEEVGAMGWALGLGLISLTSYCYFLRYQTYVLYVEIILNGFGIVFVSWEIIFGVYAVVLFTQDQSGF